MSSPKGEEVVSGVQNEKNGDEKPSSTLLWDKEFSKRALDELFTLTTQYKSTKQYNKLLQFITSFRRYSPFNAMLIYIQKPGSVYVAPPCRWLRDYNCRVKPNAQPIVILQPRGPVMFVFDVSDTEGDSDFLPPEIKRPLEIKSGHIGNELEHLIKNGKRDGIRILTAHHGAHRGGSIGPTETEGQYIQLDDKNKNQVPLRYELLISEHLTREARFATLAHELGHLYCGHIGTPEPRWWPDRQGLSENIFEFEAESVAYLVCKRKAIEPISDTYLSGYLENDKEMPTISLERVMAAAGLIENMANKILKPRKKPTDI
jgi:hypothetical protein